MKRYIIVILALFSLIVLSSACYGQSKLQLTTSQKVKDFEFLYTVLKENYPYFGVGKRANNIDWLSKKDEYINRIEKSESDTAYICVLQAILRELGNGHVDMSYVEYWDSYTELYKKIADREPNYGKWVNILTNPAARSPY